MIPSFIFVFTPRLFSSLFFFNFLYNTKIQIHSSLLIIYFFFFSLSILVDLSPLLRHKLSLILLFFISLKLKPFSNLFFFSMSYLSMVEAKLPPGFRFHPRDDELICDYLNPKVLSSSSSSSSGDASVTVNFSMLVDVDLNKCEPWDLPGEITSLAIIYINMKILGMSCYFS